MPMSCYRCYSWRDVCVAQPNQKHWRLSMKQSIRLWVDDRKWESKNDKLFEENHNLSAPITSALSHTYTRTAQHSQETCVIIDNEISFISLAYLDLLNINNKRDIKTAFRLCWNHRHFFLMPFSSTRFTTEESWESDSLQFFFFVVSLRSSHFWPDLLHLQVE